jgi:hypothetical protein
MSLHFDDKRVPQRNVVQVRNERRPLGCITRAQRPSEDQVVPGQGPHANTTSVQIRAMAIVQGGQGGK